MAGEKVLVAYATKHGSTREIAEEIGHVLSAAGLVVDVKPAAQVRFVAPYQAVILGSALYANRWRLAARRFARKFKAQLKQKPVWLFSSGPLDHSADQGLLPPVKHAERVLHAVSAREHVTFGGRLAEDAPGLVERLMIKAGQTGEFRNFDRIREWAASISRELAAAVPTAARFVPSPEREAPPPPA